MSHAAVPEAQRILVTGAGGQLGREILRIAPGALGLTRKDLDITDAGAVSRLLRAGDVLINCAAYTAVDAAESDRDTAFVVNALGPALLADSCAQAGARLVQVSTDYVFDGKATRPYEPEDRTGPLGVYGKSKLAGEQAVLGSGAAATVVRTSWVYNAQGTDFVATMGRLERERETVEVVEDQTGSPTYAADLAAGLLELVKHPNPPRLLHAAGGGQASRYELARAIFELVGADPERVRPCSSEKFARPAPRPGYSVLSGVSWQQAGLLPLRDWREALAEAVGSWQRTDAFATRRPTQYPASEPRTDWAEGPTDVLYRPRTH